jgi:LAS superfamily LD-carboxypeptidase LdcB
MGKKRKSPTERTNTKETSMGSKQKSRTTPLLSWKEHVPDFKHRQNSGESAEENQIELIVKKFHLSAINLTAW